MKNDINKSINGEYIHCSYINIFNFTKKNMCKV